LGGDGDDDFVDRLMPGILVMFLTFAVTLGSQSMVEDRRLGTLERLMTTRLTLGQMFVGKFLAGLFRAMFQALVLLSLGFAALQVAGAFQYFQVMAFCLLIAGAVAAIGLAIGALATSRDQAVWAGVVITMFMTVFGGTFFPVDGALDVLSRFTLNRYAIDALDSIISGGESLLDQGLEAAVMAGVALVALAVARWGFRATDR
jgi:ABC-2 type transport system permease protein